MARSRKAKPQAKHHSWASLSDRELLRKRPAKLGLAIEGTWLEGPIGRAQKELEQRGLRFKPHFWLSDEWLTPDGVPGVAIPFFLAHPRLMRLERRQMLQVEGGTQEECMRLLRHELGHAVCNAYRLHRRAAWRKTFGKPSTPYPRHYRPNPGSKHFVQHLDGWYAQSHPDEDFAETFAVWLRPGSDWRRRYRGWPALKKLELVDRMMAELARVSPPVRSRRKPYVVTASKQTLEEYYEAKRGHYSVTYSDSHDRELRRLFPADRKARSSISASKFLRKHRVWIRELVCGWTGEYQFTVDQVLRQMIARCQQLKLRSFASERRLAVDCAILVTVHTMHTLFRRRWHPL
jgi:hypothetical protein